MKLIELIIEFLRNLMNKKEKGYRLEIIRHKISFSYKCYPDMASCFENNWKNNSQDEFRFLYDEDVLFSCKCQSVANYNWGDYETNGKLEYGDTIKGTFQVKLFVEPRNFHGEIHGIINAKDYDGQSVNEHSMQVVDGYQTGRWLIHDKFSFKTNSDTNYAWSAGCFILSSKDLEGFNKLIKTMGFKPDDIIDGKVIEQA